MMPLAYQDVPARLRQRCCLVCGYDGPELQIEHGDETYRCPACDADLYARPPRSYAEMEGLAVRPRPDPVLVDQRQLADIKVKRAIPLWIARVLHWLHAQRRRHAPTITVDTPDYRSK